MTAPAEWAKVIDAPYEELRTLVFERALTREPGLYAEALLAYFQSDDSGMAQAEQGAHDPDTKALILLRRLLRGTKRDSSTFEAVLGKITATPWALGEARFLEGAWRESIGEFPRSAAAYQEAQGHYVAIGAPRKSLRSELNALVVSTRISPRRFLAPQYLSVLRRSEALGERDLQAQCESLLSRAFQRLGCLNLAKSHAERALALSSESFGALQRQRIEAHLALVLIESGQLAAAESWIESLTLSESEEIRTISNLLIAARTDSKALPEATWAKLNSAWRERWLEFLSKDWSTTELEGQLIAILTEKPCTLVELQTGLYPDLKSQEASEFRTREILRRVRKRWPGLITREEALYSLDPTFELPEL